MNDRNGISLLEKVVKHHQEQEQPKPAEALANVSHGTLRRLVMAGNILHSAFREIGGAGVESRAELEMWEAALARLRSEVNIPKN